MVMSLNSLRISPQLISKNETILVLIQGILVIASLKKLWQKSCRIIYNLESCNGSYNFFIFSKKLNHNFLVANIQSEVRLKSQLSHHKISKYRWTTVYRMTQQCGVTPHHIMTTVPNISLIQSPFLHNFKSPMIFTNKKENLPISFNFPLLKSSSSYSSSFLSSHHFIFHLPLHHLMMIWRHQFYCNKMN